MKTKQEIKGQTVERTNEQLGNPTKDVVYKEANGRSNKSWYETNEETDQVTIRQAGQADERTNKRTNDQSEGRKTGQTDKEGWLRAEIFDV